MQKITSVLVLTTFLAALAAVEGKLVLSCNHDDLPCLRNSTSLFLRKTQNGIAILNLLPIDPLFLKKSELSLIGAAYKFSNITVHGLKDANLDDFNLDMLTKSVAFTISAKLNVFAPLEITEITEVPLTESVYVSQELYSTVTVRYHYELKKLLIYDHFVIGPETLDCNILPPLTKQNSRTGLLRAPKDLGQEIDGMPAEALCAVVKDAYKVIIQNLRQVAKIVPAKYIIKDIKNIIIEGTK